MDPMNSINPINPIDPINPINPVNRINLFNSNAGCVFMELRGSICDRMLDYITYSFWPHLNLPLCRSLQPPTDLHHHFCRPR